MSTGCLTTEEKKVCQLLLASKTSFVPFIHDRRIRLALTQPIPASLDLTIQHGNCSFSCEGGELAHCPIVKEDQIWPDASQPFYIKNCTPSHNYCVSASIGECCPFCTDTVFMEEFQQEYYHEEEWEWTLELIIVITLLLILFSLCFVAVLKNYFRDLESRRWKSQNIIHKPLTHHILVVDDSKPSTQVVCLYLKENNPFLLDMVRSVEEFLRGKGINVIDIYDEEEIINQSVVKWVQTVVRGENPKILLCDSAATRRLWNQTSDSRGITRPLDQVFYLMRSWLPLTHVHRHLFVVRFQGVDLDTKTFIDLSDGRCYMYPIHRERLASDLKS